MKKLFFISVLAALTLTSCFCPKEALDTQDGVDDYGFEKGDWIASGRANYFTEKQGDNKETNFKLNPCFGYFPQNNLELGLGVKYASEKIDFGTSEDKINTIGVGPYLRWYCAPEKRFSPFLRADIDYRSIDYNTPFEDYKQNGLAASIGFGASYSITPKIALTAEYAGLSYETLNDKRDGFDNISSFNARFSPKSLRLGAAFIID